MQEDLVSREDAIKAACEGFCHPGAFCPDTGCRELEPLKTVPAAERWIPCSERYPDMDERVLVYTVAHEYHVWDCMSNRADNYFWEDEDGLYHDKYEADLWMPLPEPYKGEHDG